MRYPAFVGGSNPVQSWTQDQERTVNWYVEEAEVPGAQPRMVLLPTPGVTELSTAGAGPGFAHFFENGREFAVLGDTFYEIDSIGTLTSRGTVAIGSTPATISSNVAKGGELFITAGNNGYLFTLATNAFALVRTGGSRMGAMLNGYFLALNDTDNKIEISDLNDGATWDAERFISRSVASDPWVSMVVANRYIYALGSQTAEVWYDQGTQPVPFAFHPSGLIPYGCAAPFSTSEAEGTVYWLVSTEQGAGSVMRVNGFSPAVISSQAVARVFEKFSTVEDAIGDTYEEDGHDFYMLSLPTEQETWAWDKKTGNWAERGTWIAEDMQFVDWRPRFHAYAFGEHRMLDGSTGAVYRMANSLTSDVDSRPIRRVRRAPALSYDRERLYYSAFELDLDRGLGTSTGQGVNPQVGLRASNDGGRTFGAERFASAGKIGEYQQRVRWNRLGMARRRVFEISVTDPIPWRIVDAYLTMTNMPQGIRQPPGGPNG